ncbi:MAG: hypothetical protein WC058_05150 [Phycisphaeraceae bacterium]
MLGLILVAAGLAIWHRLGRALGFGSDAAPVRRAAVIGVWCATAVIAMVQWGLNVSGG